MTTTELPPGGQMQQPQQAPAPASSTAPQQSQQGLPPTGLQQQLTSLNQFYSNVKNAKTQAGGIGFDPRQQQFQQAQLGGGSELDPNQGADIGGSSLDAMARNLAQRYGLPIGKGRLVDEYGNFLVTPQQLADASGGNVTMGEAAAQMNYISDAITRRQNEQQQQKGIAAIQTGMGQVQSRGRGSLATMMSGYYQDLADLYSNQQYEAADFSYYIQKEQLDIQRELQARAEKLAKKQARGQFITGIGLTVAGLATGNFAGVAAGGGMIAGSAGNTGWF